MSFFRFITRDVSAYLKMEEKEAQSFDILQMGMLSGSEFSDQQLEQILNMGKIRPTEKPDMPPQILWVDDCTLATFGN